MADKEKKPARSSTMYGKGPRIEDKDVSVKERSGGAPEPAKTVSAGNGDMKSGGAPKGDVMAGTDGIPTSHHEHARERDSMHHRHMAEHHSMHERHERDHLMHTMGHAKEDMEAMHERHEGERRSMHTRHESERKTMHERHEGMGEGPTGGIKEEPKPVDKAGKPE